MRKTEIIEGEKFEIISSNEKCLNCSFQCKIIISDMKRISISCKHPKGPGNPVHCIYFKRLKTENCHKVYGK